MATDDERRDRYFLEVYGTLPRAGPGADDQTLRALELVPGPTPRRVLDLGCGPGAQTLALARALPEARIVAVDLLPSMIDEVRRRATEAGLVDRIEARVADMADPGVGDASQDLIWSEGAIYNVGVRAALELWSPWLRPGGSIVFTEPIWLVEHPSSEILAWWESEYTAITDEAGIRSQVAAAGCATVATFTLPRSSWWDEYYEPMSGRIAALRTRLPDDPIATEVADAAELEIDHHRRFGDEYSYACFVVQPVRRP